VYAPPLTLPFGDLSSACGGGFGRGRLVSLAALLAVGVTVGILACALWENWWPLFVCALPLTRHSYPPPRPLAVVDIAGE